jgi:hypothetical protein
MADLAALAGCTVKSVGHRDGRTKGMMNLRARLRDNVTRRGGDEENAMDVRAPERFEPIVVRVHVSERLRVVELASAKERVVQRVLDVQLLQARSGEANVDDRLAAVRVALEDLRHRRDHGDDGLPEPGLELARLLDGEE